MPAEPSGNRTIESERVRSWIGEKIGALLGGEVRGYRATTDMVVAALMHAATERTNLHAACQALDIADDTTMRDHLNRLATPAAWADLIARMNEQVVADLPDELRQLPQNLAIDYHDMPYYGWHADMDEWVCRGPARSGTTRFLFATL